MHSPDPGPGAATELAELGREARWLARVAGRLIADPALAEDACQDTWLAAHRRSRSAVPARAELLKGLRGFVSVARRGERRRRDRERRAARDERLPSAADIAARDEQIERMWTAVAELQEPLRSTLVLHYRHEATTAEIAERLGLAQDTVRWRLRKGVAELRSKLDRDEAGGGLAAMAVLLSRKSVSASAVVTGGAALTAASFSLHKVLFGAVAAVAATCLLWMALDVPTALEPASALGPGVLESATVLPLPGTTQATDGEPETRVALAAARESAEPTSQDLALAPPDEWTLRAVDESGHPVPEAEVHIALSGQELTRKVLGETDANGDFSIDAWPGQPVSLWTEKSGYQNGFADLRRRGGESRDLGELVMPPAAALYARIVDEFGRGVPGAVLFVERSPDLAGQWGLPPGREDWRVADANGSIGWTNLSPATRRFWIHTNLYRDRIVAWDGASEGTDSTSPAIWRVVEGDVLHGRVEGRPAGESPPASENAALLVVAHLGASSFGSADFLGGPTAQFFGRGPSSTLEDDGSFTLRGLHPGATYRLCMRESYPRETAFNRSLGVMDAFSLCEPKDVSAEAGTVVLQWRRPASVTFRVEVSGRGDWPTDLRASSMNQALGAALRQHGALVPDESGRCTVETLPTGRGKASLAISSKGYSPAFVEFEALEAGDEVDVGVLELRPVPRARVLVKDAATGEGVEGASVYTSREQRGAPAPQRPAVAMTDGSGWADVEFHESSTQAISVRHPEFAERVLKGQALESGQQLVVELRKGGQAIVIVSGEVLGQRILCKPISGEAALGPTVRRTNALSGLRIESREPDATGRATFDHLVAGEYEFFTFGGELSIAESTRLMSPARRAGSVRATVTDGASITVELDGSSPFVLEGTLTMDGAPLAGAKVSLFDPLRHDGEALWRLQQGYRIPTCVTARDGRYTLEHTEAGEFLLVIQSDRCVVAQEQPVVLDSPLHKLDLDLTRCVVEGRVVDSSGAPVADQVILARLSRDKQDPLRNAHSDHRVRTGADGHYRLVGLPGGKSFSIQSHGRGWQGTYAGPFRLEEGEVRGDVDLVTDRSADLTITVDRGSDAARRIEVELRMIEAFPETGGGLPKSATHRRRVSIREGTRSTTAEDLTPGRYTVEWQHAGRVVASKEVDVSLDVDNRISFEE
ncbi:sigma-70 family RNA polymerase sigma factor [Saltatorellus ferox]